MDIWENQQDGCHRCSGCPGRDSPYPLYGVGNPESPIMLIGQEPAYNVDEENVDSSMSYHEARRQWIEDRRSPPNPLWKHMMNVGLAFEMPPDQLYFTNLVKCAAGDWDERLENCQPYLGRELGEVDPKVIILHGSKVISVVLQMFDIDWSGTVSDVHTESFVVEDTDIVCFYHWGYPYRTGSIDEYNREVRETLQELQ